MVDAVTAETDVGAGADAVTAEIDVGAGADTEQV